MRYECKVKLEPADLTAPVSFVAKQRRLLTLLKVGCKRNYEDYFVFRPETEADKTNPYNITVFIDAAKASKDEMEFYAGNDQEVVTKGERRQYSNRVHFPDTVHQVWASNLSKSRET